MVTVAQRVVDSGTRPAEGLVRATHHACACDIIKAATAEESGASPERSRHCDPDIRSHQHEIREVRTSAPLVVVASRVRRPDPGMPRARIPAGRV